MIRAYWSRVGGLKAQLSPMQAKAFQIAEGHTPVAQMSFASQVPLAWQSKGGNKNLMVGRFSSKQIPAFGTLSSMLHALCRRFISGSYVSHLSKTGFTLLELVIAIAILTVVFTSLYSAFNSTLNTTEAVERERDVEQAARLGLMRIADDLESLYSLEIEGASEASPYSFLAQDTESLDEGGTVLEFSTSGHLDFNMIFPSLRINRVLYALKKQPGTEHYYRLLRGESPFAGLVEEGQQRVVEVAENVEGLSLTFIDADGGVQSQWDSTAPESQGRLPRLVRIRLQLAGDKSRVFATTVAIPPISKKEEG